MLRLPITQPGVVVPRWLAGVLSIALCFSTEMPMARAESPSPSPTPGETQAAQAAAADSDGDGTPDRPDLVSAGVTARVLGVAVEDLSQRSERVRVLVNPDGTLEQESHAAPVWVKDADGKWVDVDYTLVARDGGGFAPKASPSSVLIDGGGAKEFARLDLPGGGSTVWSWPEDLPTPAVEGPTATYAVVDGVDLLVTATPMGVSTRIRINTAEAVVPEFTVKVRTTGVDLSQSGDGQLVFSDGDDTAGHTASLLAWDGRRDKFGDPLEVVPVEATLGETATRGSRTDQDLTLTTPTELVDDPDVVYPIVVDPELSPLSPSQDTWVRKDTTTIENGYRLMTGRLDGSPNDNPTISYLQWPNGEISGRKILSGKLYLLQYAAGSCGSRTMNIHPLGGAWSDLTTKYTDKPIAMTSTGTSSTLTKNLGGDGCSAPNGFVSADITKMVQAWADGPTNGGFTNYGIQLNTPSGNASDVTYERRFCSVNPDPSHTSCKTSSEAPYLKLVYNSAPLQAGWVSMDASRTFDGKLWTSTATPTLSTSATDAEASKVNYSIEVRTSTDATDIAASCITGQVAAGSTASCKPATALTDGHSYVVRARATDEHGLAGDWSEWRSFGVDTTAPSTPFISCDGYGSDTWLTSRISSTTTCAFTSSGVADFEWRRTQAGTVEDQPAVVASGGAGTTAAIPVPEAGVVKIEARARNKSGIASAWKTLTFGIGSAAITQPMLDDRSTSTFPVQALAGEGATSARVQWRYAPDTEGDTTNGWNEATKLQLKSTGATWTGTLASTTPFSQIPLLTWTPSKELGISVPSTVQLRVVFAYPGGVEMPSPLQRVLLIPHAFGGSYPTKEVGPGAISLFTGEYQLSETDVSVPGAGGNLTLGRTHGTLTGDLAGPAGVFGPGWTADFSGEGTGAAGYVVTDNTAIDGTIILTSPAGDSDVYAHSTGTKGSLKVGAYEGVGETSLNLARLNLATGGGTGISHTLTLTELDGTITQFQRTTAGVWSTHKTVEPEDNSTVQFVRDSNGLITWILAPAPAGVTCSATTQTKGCRALKFSYTTINGGARLTKVQYVAWDPKPGTDGTPTAAAAMTSIDVAGYAYDSAGRLIETWQPNVSGDSGTGHKTLYEYTTINSKTAITKQRDPGLVPWRFDYDSEGRLAHVKRALDPAVGTGDATWTIAYDTPLVGGGLPDLTANSIAAWGQLAADAPAGAAAVFEPDHVPGLAPTSTDWPYATISYYNQAGRTTNTAVFGAGHWLIDSIRYDAQGNATWSLSAAGRDQALAEPDPATAADKYAILSVYNAAGTRVEETYTPMREVVLSNGHTVFARTVVTTGYDDEADSSLMPGRPTSGVPEGGYQLAIEQRAAVTDRILPNAEGNTWDTRKVRYRYDPVSSGDTSGWLLRVPTRTLTQDGDGWATALTRYDETGRVVETRTTGGTAITDGSSSDTYSTRTIYYTADNSAPESSCRSKPEWEANPCITRSAGDPSSGAPIPRKTTLGYSVLGAVTRTEETASTSTRVVVTAYDYKSRPTASSTTLAGAVTISGTTGYDATTGTITSTTRAGLTETLTYDSWGRQLTRADGTGNLAATTYDVAGRTSTFNDGKGTYTYTWDGTDNQGKAEHRGLATRIDLGYASGDADQVTGSYDAAGSITKETLPGGYVKAWTYNTVGQATALSYTQAIGDVPVPILGFTQTYDHYGRVVTATGPAGSQRYSYDDRARLTRVEDTTSEGCTTRSYTFAGDSNRTSLTSYSPGSAGACQTSVPAAAASYTYDEADRITTPGYTYDQLGRTLTVPKVHTNQAEDALASALTVSYAANDMVASIQQTIRKPGTGDVQVRKQTFGLDGADRISVTKTFADNVQLAEALNHYDSESDSPAWTQTKTRADANDAWTTTWNRYLSDLSGSLAIDVNDAGAATVQLANLHGDVVGTAILGLAGISSYVEADEFGAPKAGGAGRYSWLGTQQRDTEVIGGLILMGARLYVPVTGRFLSIDAADGANANRYTYPVDPINQMDTSGRNPLVVALGIGAGELALITAISIVVGVGSVAAAFLLHRLLAIGKDMLWRLATNTWLTQAVVKVAYTTYRWNYTYRGYEVLYQDHGKWKTWKYGITSVAGNSRPLKGVAKCQASGYACKFKWRANYLPGYWTARQWEYAMIAAYAVRHWGRCPPGQWLSCK
ncbi:MAG: hypothetical protein LCH96_04835 [Actinobacteria bacterium]|nr:hypothetical protein [Actinomycetota bacterium]